MHLLESSLPCLGAVEDSASIGLPVCISLKTSGIRRVVSEKGNHPSSALSAGHNFKDTGQRTRRIFVSESSRSYCSSTAVQYLEETTQKVRRKFYWYMLRKLYTTTTTVVQYVSIFISFKGRRINSLHSRSQDPAARFFFFTIYTRQHGTCVKFSQKNAEFLFFKARGTLTTDRRCFQPRQS